MYSKIGISDITDYRIDFILYLINANTYLYYIIIVDYSIVVASRYAKYLL